QHERGIPLADQGLGMVAASEKKDAVWEFIKFMVPGQPPANMHTVIESTLYARFHPKHRNWPDAWSRIRPGVSPIFVGSAAPSQAPRALGDVIPALSRRHGGRSPASAPRTCGCRAACLFSRPASVAHVGEQRPREDMGGGVVA